MAGIDVALGAAGGSTASVSRYTYTATASQTAFTGLDDSSQTLDTTGVVAGVTLNGVTLVEGVDWSESGGDTITLTSGAALSDIVHIVCVDLTAVASGGNLTGGFTSTAYDHGTVTTGTITPAPAAGEANFQTLVNGGDFTLAPPANDCTVVIEVTNNGTAGAITVSGFTVTSGDSFDTTDTNVFLCHITTCGGSSSLNVEAMQ